MGPMGMGRPRKSDLTGPKAGRALTLAVAVALAVMIYALREVLPNPNEGVTNLYAIPIAIAAVHFGAWGGAAAALASLALFAEWEMTNDDVMVGPIGYASRGVAFLLLGVIVGRFATERRALVARLTEAATTDALTGLSNRAKFAEDFAAELARARRYGHTGALLLADLDGFKSVNDTIGHRAGDEVLKRVTEVLRQELRATDYIARAGGDEFVILLPETTATEAEAVTRKLKGAVVNSIREVDGRPVTLGVSVGSVCFDGNTPDSPESLLDAADEAMYQDKVSQRQ
ncbi:MAG: GGDEF domain-containing protein [Actinomycetota bacterium]|nr:GGDEF domain-containing protein [Actinomycetota bacterium]